MPLYFLYLLAGAALAVGSEKIDALTGRRPWVRKLIRLAPLLVLIGMAQGAVELMLR